MEQNSFFKWIGRINSMCFLILILMSIGLILFLFVESNDWNAKRTVEVKDKSDSSEDGRLSEDDLVKVSITSPDGSNYTELGSYQSVIDHETDREGKILTLLAQVGSDILVQKYSLTDFKKLSEKKLTRIEKKT